MASLVLSWEVTAGQGLPLELQSVKHQDALNDLHVLSVFKGGRRATTDKFSLSPCQSGAAQRLSI